MPKPKPAAPASTAAPTKPRKHLRDAQVRILEALASGPLNRKDLAEKASVSSSDLTSYLGHMNEEKRRANDEKWFLSLITLGYVKANVKKDQEKGTETYQTTPAGKAALSKAQKEKAQAS